MTSPKFELADIYECFFFQFLTFFQSLAKSIGSLPDRKKVGVNFRNFDYLAGISICYDLRNLINAFGTFWKFSNISLFFR